MRPALASLARARSLARLGGDDGIVVGVAVDHRDSLRAALAGAGHALDDVAIGRFKADVLEALAPHATLVLVDSELGLEPALERGAIPACVAIATPLEQQGYGELHMVRRTTLLADWTPRQAREIGADACKLLLPIRPDREADARAQIGVAREAVESCAGAGMPLILEPVVWTQPGEVLEPDRFADLVCEAARMLAPLDPGLLKLQYPGSAMACERLDRACGATPWVLLGGGQQPEVLVRQVGDACRAGASGFIVGRSLFAGAVEDPARARVAAKHVVPTLRRLAEVARDGGHPLFGR